MTDDVDRVGRGSQSFAVRAMGGPELSAGAGRNRLAVGKGMEFCNLRFLFRLDSKQQTARRKSVYRFLTLMPEHAPVVNATQRKDFGS